jgi:hypothetical protein
MALPSDRTVPEAHLLTDRLAGPPSGFAGNVTPVHHSRGSQPGERRRADLPTRQSIRTRAAGAIGNAVETIMLPILWLYGPRIWLTGAEGLGPLHALTLTLGEPAHSFCRVESAW